MTALIVLGSILLFFALVLSLRVKVTVEYNGEVTLVARVLFFNIRILPKRKKKSGPHSMSEKKAKRLKARLEKKAQKKRQKAEQKKKKKQEKKELEKKHPEIKKKRSLSEILEIIGLVKAVVAAVVKTFFKHLRIDLARLHVTVSTGDAATTAIAYGAVSEAAFYLFNILEPLKGFDLPDVQDFSINADFLEESSSVDVKISFSIRVWHVFHVLLSAARVAIVRLVRMQAKKPRAHINK